MPDEKKPSETSTLKRIRKMSVSAFRSTFHPTIAKEMLKNQNSLDHDSLSTRSSSPYHKSPIKRRKSLGMLLHPEQVGELEKSSFFKATKRIFKSADETSNLRTKRDKSPINSHSSMRSHHQNLGSSVMSLASSKESGYHCSNETISETDDEKTQIPTVLCNGHDDISLYDNVPHEEMNSISSICEDRKSTKSFDIKSNCNGYDSDSSYDSRPQTPESSEDEMINVTEEDSYDSDTVEDASIMWKYYYKKIKEEIIDPAKEQSNNDSMSLPGNFSQFI